MLPVSLVHTDGSLSWQHRLKAISSVEIRIGRRGRKYWCSWEDFFRLGVLLQDLPPGLVFLGSSSFHHLSYHLLRRYATQPLTLVVFDRHGDCFPAPSGYVTCGSWLAEALSLPGIRDCLLIGSSDQEEVPPGVRRVAIEKASEAPLPTSRVYISIDKDVLAEASTDWGSGTLRLEEVLGLLSWLRQRYELVGADVCGELIPLGPWITDAELRQIRKNEEINLSLWQALGGAVAV